MGSKRKARIYAMQALFAYETEPSQREDLLALGWLSDIQREKLSDGIRFFIASLIQGTIDNQAELDELIAQNLNNWQLNRIPQLTRSVLRMASYELSKLDTPATIVITEACEIAREYGGDESASFVQGVLNGIQLSLENGIEGNGLGETQA